MSESQRKLANQTEMIIIFQPQNVALVVFISWLLPRRKSSPLEVQPRLAHQVSLGKADIASTEATVDTKALTCESTQFVLDT